MSNIPHETGRVSSGDVTLFYRKLGAPGAAPLIILHGGNYYDSIDWLPIAAAVAQGREVVVYDQRGMGESTWSPSQNYTNDAIFDDVLALLDHFGWRRAVLLGQSRNAMRAISFAGQFPDRVAGVIMADSLPGSGPPHKPGAAPEPKPKVYPTIDALIAELSNYKDAPAGSPYRARLESLAKKVEGGFIVGKRDPDMDAKAPTTPGWTSKYPPADPWAEVAAVKAPILLLKAKQSKSCKPESVERVQNEFKQIEIAELESGHDIPAMAGEAAAAAITRFLNTRLA